MWCGDELKSFFEEKKRRSYYYRTTNFQKNSRTFPEHPIFYPGHDAHALKINVYLWPNLEHIQIL